MTKIPTSGIYFQANPILGSSEGEQRSKKLKERYANFIRHNVKELHRKKSKDQFLKQQQIKKDREKVQNLMMRRNEVQYNPIDSHNITPIKGILPKNYEIENYHRNFETPLRSSGIHNRVNNEWKNNLTFDDRNYTIHKSSSLEKFSPEKTNSESNSLRRSYERRSHSPLDRKRQKEDYAYTLMTQISEKEEQRKKLKEMGKCE